MSVSTRAAIALVLGIGALQAQPKPGDIFRDYHYTSEMIVEIEPGTKLTNPKALMRRSISGRERSLDIWDLEDAIRAEVSFEFWGGHIGTSGQVFRVNGGPWIEIPQVRTTPGDPRCYHRMLPGTVTAAVDLSSLKQGRNTFEMRSGPQTCHGSNWGIYKVYGFTVRVYYSESKPHPTGKIVSPRAGAAIGDLPEIEVDAEGSKAAPGKTEFTPGPVRRVDLLGLYEDFNWEGDGVYRQWHYQTDLGELKRHIGTAYSQPYRVTWRNRWIPDQDQAVHLAARITNVHGVTYMTPAVEVRLDRQGRSVRMYKSSGIPEFFSVRAGKTMSSKIVVGDDPSAASAGRFVISTWAGNHATALSLNGNKIVDRTGKDDYYSYDELPIPPGFVRKGENVFSIYSTTEEHMAEVNWPGPVLLLEFPRTAGTRKPVEIGRSATVSEAPVFDREGNLFFSHYKGIDKLAPDGRVTKWATDESAGYNGHKILPDGTHLVCASKKGAIWRMDHAGKIIGTASSECDGKPLRAPNDLTLDVFGGFYFTDPGGSREAPIGTLHYVDAKGVTRLLHGGMSVPNGLVIDPTERYLYVAETVPDRILRFPILGPGKLGAMSVFVNLPKREGHDATPDGLAVDTAGNVYVAHLGTGHVLVYNPRAELVTTYDGGNYDVTNLAFGGPELNQLYITGATGFRSRSEGRVFRLDLPGVLGRR